MTNRDLLRGQVTQNPARRIGNSGRLGHAPPLLPVPPSLLDLLTKQFTDAAHEVREYDKNTGNPYRAWHAIPGDRSAELVDINEATGNQMWKSTVNRREQMVGDGYNLLTLDLDHWNSINPDVEPIQLPIDFTLDVEIRKASHDIDDEDVGRGFFFHRAGAAKACGLGAASRSTSWRAPCRWPPVGPPPCP